MNTIFVAALDITSLIASTGLSETLLANVILYLVNGTYHLILYIQGAVANTIRSLNVTITNSSFKCAAIGRSANMIYGSENATTIISKDKQYATEGSDLFDRSPIYDVSAWIGLCTVFAFLATTVRFLVLCHGPPGATANTTTLRPERRLAQPGDDDNLTLTAAAPAMDDVDARPSHAKHETFCAPWPAVEDASWKTFSRVNIDLEAFSCPELQRASSSGADGRPRAESFVHKLAARCTAVLSSLSSAICSRYVHGVESRVLPSSLASCDDLAMTVTACDDDHSPRRRVFGLVLPLRPSLACSLEDLEIDDGGYLRTALGMTDDGCEGGAAGFWPEVCSRPSEVY
ncbi:hypothetical protein C8Q74DRAFT_707618 [Fomes fomentarius]|nr:hypothetical protein C8Q74DRAFT_707618 [Fomes fomentarius]